MSLIRPGCAINSRTHSEFLFDGTESVAFPLDFDSRVPTSDSRVPTPESRLPTPDSQIVTMKRWLGTVTQESRGVMMMRPM